MAAPQGHSAFPHGQIGRAPHWRAPRDTAKGTTKKFSFRNGNLVQWFGSNILSWPRNQQNGWMSAPPDLAKDISIHTKFLPYLTYTGSRAYSWPTKWRQEFLSLTASFKMLEFFLQRNIKVGSSQKKKHMHSHDHSYWWLRIKHNPENSRVFPKKNKKQKRHQFKIQQHKPVKRAILSINIS